MVLVLLLLAAPAVIFWLWLVILPARVATLCPEGCRCEAGGYCIQCPGTPFNPVPLIHLTQVRVLWLYYNKIPLLENDSFVSLTELEILIVDKCGLRTIELGAFNGLTKLSELLLSGNEISEIIPGTFENMNSLEYLELMDNKLEHLDSDVFSGLGNLRHMKLGRNQLQYLHPDTFLGLPNIKQLHLDNNTGLQIPTDSNFINSPSLSRLDISLCNVSSLSNETFAKASALELLGLRQNNLRTVDINIFTALPKLFTIYLEGNPLQCDCQLQEVWRWCEDRKIRTAFEETVGWLKVPQCDTPSEVKGKLWSVLEKGQCLKGNIQYYGDYKNTRYSYTDFDKVVRYRYDVDFLRQYQKPLYAFPFIFGTIANVLLLTIIICNKDMQTVPNMYILNLAISDIILLTVLFCEACANRDSDSWLHGDFMCAFLPFTLRLSVGLSAYSVAALSFQRYRVTVNPFHVVSSHTTWRVTVATICGVWIVAALFAVPSALSKFVCEGLSFLRSISYYKHVVIFELFVSCVLPLCVIASTYITTARYLVVSSRSVSEVTKNPQLNTRKNTAKIVVGLTVVFLISYVPYHVFWTYINHTENVHLFKLVSIFYNSNYELGYTCLISTFLLSINSCLNPVALFCTSSSFRRHLNRYLACFCKTNDPPTELELQTKS